MGKIHGVKRSCGQRDTRYGVVGVVGQGVLPKSGFLFLNLKALLSLRRFSLSLDIEVGN